MDIAQEIPLEQFHFSQRRAIFDPAQQQILFNFKIEKGPKVSEIEVTMPNGQLKTQEIWNDTVIGFNKFGKEVVRTTVEEPTFERPAGHLNTI